MVAVSAGMKGERTAGGTRSRVARETGGRRSAREARSPQLPPLMSPHTNYLLILSPFYAWLKPSKREREIHIYIYILKTEKQVCGRKTDRERGVERRKPAAVKIK